MRGDADENGIDMRKCLVCEKPVQPQNEVDIKVGILYSDEAPICEECATSDNEFMQMDVADAIERWASLPF